MGDSSRQTYTILTLNSKKRTKTIIEWCHTTVTHEEDQGAPQEGTDTEQDQGASQGGLYFRGVRSDTKNVRFRSPIDEPFNSKSYYPPSQLLCEAIFGYIMTQVATNAEFANTLMQLSANASLKKHRRKAEEALLAEFAQLEDLNVYEPFLDPNKLNRAQNNQALRAISLIKESATDGSRDEW